MSSSSSTLPEQQSRVIVAARALIMLFVLVGVPVCAFFYAPVRSLIDPLIAMLQEEETTSTDDPFSESNFEGDWAQPPLQLDSMSSSGSPVTDVNNSSPFGENGQTAPWPHEIVEQPPLVHPAPIPGSDPSGQSHSWLTETPSGTIATVPPGTQPDGGLSTTPYWGGETPIQNPPLQDSFPNQVVDHRGIALPTEMTPAPTVQAQVAPQPILPTQEEIALFESRFANLNATKWTLEWSRSQPDGRIMYHFTCDVASPGGSAPSQFVATDATSVRAMDSVLFQVENWQVANANRLNGSGQRIGAVPNAGQSQRYPWLQ